MRPTATPRLGTVWVLSLAALAFSAARPCQAQSSNAAIAEALFQDGRRLIDEGQTAEGCAKLEQSQRIDPKLGTLLNVAVCHEQLGRTASAWAEYLDAEAQANRLQQSDRAAFAHEGAQRLEGQLSRLTLRANDSANELTITLDDKPFAAGLLGTALPVDPGEHRLQISAPGKKPVTLTLTIAPGPSAMALDIPQLENQELPPSPPSPAPVVAPAPAPVPQPAPSERMEPQEKSVPSWAWISLGVGAAGIVTGSITGTMALSKASQLKTDCPNNVCPEGQASDLDTALTLADISTVSFIIGAVGSAVGLTGVLTSSGEEERVGTFVRVDFGRVDVVSHF